MSQTKVKICKSEDYMCLADEYRFAKNVLSEKGGFTELYCSYS